MYHLLNIRRVLHKILPLLATRVLSHIEQVITLITYQKEHSWSWTFNWWYYLWDDYESTPKTRAFSVQMPLIMVRARETTWLELEYHFYDWRKSRFQSLSLSLRSNLVLITVIDSKMNIHTTNNLDSHFVTMNKSLRHMIEHNTKDDGFFLRWSTFPSFVSVFSPLSNHFSPLSPPFFSPFSRSLHQSTKTQYLCSNIHTMEN